jgi:C-terminal processing protease CtpA/Prc
VICSDSKSVGNDFFVRIPGRAWYTPANRLVEGIGIEPSVQVAQGEASRDPQLDRAMEVVSSL